MSQRSLREATIKIKDGTSGTPNEITIKVGDGNLTWSEKRAIEYTHDRGTIYSVREGDDEPMDVKFDFIWEWIQGTSTIYPDEAITQRGGAASWLSAGDDCEPYAVDIEITFNVECPGSNTSKQEVITLPEFRWESLDHDIKQGQISCSGKCKSKVPTIG